MALVTLLYSLTENVGLGRTSALPRSVSLLPQKEELFGKWWGLLKKNNSLDMFMLTAGKKA